MSLSVSQKKFEHDMGQDRSTRSKRYKKTLVILAILFTVLLIVYLLVQFNDNSEKTLKISELLSASIYLAEHAGKVVRDVRLDKNSGIAEKLKTSSNGGKEYVTLGDQLSHQIITKGLKALWPNLPYRSEERDSHHHNAFSPNGVSIPPLYNPDVEAVSKNDEAVNIEDVSVWIDPLDATQEYTEGNKRPELLEYVTVMICIVIKDRPIASVIHQPFISKGKQDGATYWSWIDHGVSSNLRTTTAAHAKTPPRIITSRSHPGDVKKVIKSAFKGTQINHVTAAGAGYKSLQIALKKSDLYLHTTKIKKWDTCAGHAVISAMGGVMTSRNGDPIRYNIGSDPVIKNGIIAAGFKRSYEEYLKKLKNA